jgi:adenosylcobinamide-GDP ribazoletransferase
MKRIFVAINFLTRLSVPPNLRFESDDIGRATLFFPLVGALIGLIQIAGAHLFAVSAFGNTLKSVLVAALLVVINVFVTGALHLDGLADMADGFGGGHTKERTLEIMRDSLIGSFGAVGLVLLIILKVAAIAALVEG